MQPTPQHILIVRLSAIGDVVMCSGMINALRARYPQAKISWLAEAIPAQMIAKHPHLNQVFYWSKQAWLVDLKALRWIKLYRQMREFRQQMQTANIDLVVDVQGLFKSGLVSWLSGAARRVGFRSKEGANVFHTEVIDKTLNEQMSSEYIGMAEYLGAQASDFRLQVGLDASDQQAVSDLLTSRQLDQTFIAVAPFTTRPQKHWVDSHWQQLLEQLASHYPVLILGAPHDRAYASRLQGQLSNVYNLCGDLSLTAVSALIGRAKLFVGVDTGLTHVAVAADVPTFALFGSTRPYTTTANPTAKVLYKAMPCAPCKRKPSCAGRFDCMQALTPEMVWQHLSAWL